MVEADGYILRIATKEWVTKFLTLQFTIPAPAESGRRDKP